jgi:predicted DCC family thiol-disulfide oxidoreductase YuxK
MTGAMDPAKALAARLRDPDAAPDADVVIYDGNCGFCRNQVQRLARWDRAGKLAFLSLHDPRVAARYPDLDRDTLLRQMYVVDRRGKRHGGAAALRYLSRRLPRLWFLAPPLHIPGTLALWQWLYNQVARRRYGLGGAGEACDSGACRIHGP